MYIYNGKYSGIDDYWSDVYCSDVNLRIRKYKRGLSITDLTNSLKTGQLCPVFSFEWDNEEYSINYYDIILHPDIIKNFNMVAANNFHNIPEDIRIKIYNVKGIYTFSPFAKVKKQDLSKKITNIKIVKAILSGQIRYITKTYENHDNYYYDLANQRNLHQSLDVMEFAEEFLYTNLPYVFEKDNNLLRITWHGWEDAGKSYVAYLNE